MGLAHEINQSTFQVGRKFIDMSKIFRLILKSCERASTPLSVKILGLLLQVDIPEILLGDCGGPLLELVPGELELVVPVAEGADKVRKEDVELRVGGGDHSQFGPHVAEHRLRKKIQIGRLKVLDAAKLKTHFNRDAFESNLTVPGIRLCHENTLFKSFETSPNLISQ